MGLGGAEGQKQSRAMYLRHVGCCSIRSIEWVKDVWVMGKRM